MRADTTHKTKYLHVQYPFTFLWTAVQFTTTAAHPCKFGWQNLLSKKQNAFLKAVIYQVFLESQEIVNYKNIRQIILIFHYM